MGKEQKWNKHIFSFAADKIKIQKRAGSRSLIFALKNGDLQAFPDENAVLHFTAYSFAYAQIFQVAYGLSDCKPLLSRRELSPAFAAHVPCHVRCGFVS